MRRFRFTLQDLFGVTLLVATVCVIAFYIRHSYTRIVIDVVLHFALVVASSIVAGKYVTRAPFPAGFMAAVAISMLLSLNGETAISHLIADLTVPAGDNDYINIFTAVDRAKVLVDGMLGGLIAHIVARAGRTSSTPQAA